MFSEFEKYKSQQKENPLVEKLIEQGGVWLGENFTSSTYLEIAPGSWQVLSLNTPEGSLPIEISGDIQGEELTQLLLMQIRSKLAQSGLNCGGFQVVWNKKRSQVEMEVINLGGRSITIPEGNGVCNAYSLYGADLLQGNFLGEAVSGENGIKIEGNFGTDWLFIDKNYQQTNNAEEAVAIALKLGQDRFVIPQADKPIVVCQEENYRRYLDTEVLVKAGREESLPDFTVTETTASLSLGNIHGVLDHRVLFIPPDRDQILTARTIDEAVHINSLLIQGNHTNWPIRCETLGLDQRDGWYVVMHLFKDVNKSNCSESLTRLEQTISIFSQV